MNAPQAEHYVAWDRPYFETVRGASATFPGAPCTSGTVR